MSATLDDRIIGWLSAVSAAAADLADRFALIVDALIAVAVCAASIGGLAVQHRLGPLSVAFAVALVAPLPAPRRRPRVVFLLVAVIALMQWLLDVPQLADASVLLALYWVARRAEPIAVLGAAVTTEVGAIIAAARWAPADPVKIWVGLTGLAVAATVLGVTVRQHRALLASLHERASRLELELDQEVRLGAAAERARIAREMHDVVSHNLTVMIALADAATYTNVRSSTEATATMQRVSEIGRHALQDMRRLLGVLRDAPASGPLEPQPGLDRLDELIAQVRAAGLPVAVELHGDPHALDEGVQLTVYRVVQEALTNTLKHASAPSGARVNLVCAGSDRVSLDVIDDGSPVPAPVAGAGAGGGDGGGGGGGGHGRGLLGMSERAIACGGTVSAGPRPDGGWQVRLRLADGAPVR